MSRYILITNIWGKLPYKSRGFVWDNLKSNNYPDYIDYEKNEFDTYEEMMEFIKLFEELCSTLTLPKKIRECLKKNKIWHEWGEGERLWGWLAGDSETMTLKWGGYKLKDYNASTDKRELYDILFRGEDEIPKNYFWDSGEYEGWLQFRWGDGKNAIGYVPPKNIKKQKPKIEDIAEDHSEEYYEDYMKSKYNFGWDQAHPSEFAAQLEEAISKYEEEHSDELQRIADQGEV